MLALAAVAAMAPAAWKQDRFISMCNDPIVEPAELGFRYREMAEANFTLVSSTARRAGSRAQMGRANTDGTRSTALQAAEGPGLYGRGSGPRLRQRHGAVPHANPALLVRPAQHCGVGCGRRAKSSGSVSCFDACGLQSTSFARTALLRELAAQLRFPANGPAGNWSSYEQYVDFFIATYKPQVLCFDHYLGSRWAMPPPSRLQLGPILYPRSTATARISR